MRAFRMCLACLLLLVPCTASLAARPSTQQRDSGETSEPAAAGKAFESTPGAQ